MPRTHPPRTTTLYVPPADRAADPPGGAASSSTPPSLDVLLVAQQIAHSRGHTFDIESFLSPEQREEYMVLLGEGSDGTGGDEDEAASTTSESSRAAKRPRIEPSLSKALWRQRLDRLTDKSRRSATPGTPGRLSVKPEPGDDRVSLRSSTPARAKDVITPADRVDIQASASYWNHLLIQARAARGPQWDYNTQMLQVDQHSETYYSHGLPPPKTPPKPEPKKLPEQLPNGSAPAAKDKEPSKETPANGDTKGASAQASASPAPSTPARPPAPSAPSRSPSGGGTPGRFAFNAPGGQGYFPPGQQGATPGASPQGSAQGPQSAQGTPGVPPHLRMQQAAQANVQAQALALGQSGGFNLNPAMLMQQQQQQQGQQGGPGVNPMNLMGGGRPPGMHPGVQMPMQPGGQMQMPMGGQYMGQGPMVAGGQGQGGQQWEGQGFQ